MSKTVSFLHTGTIGDCWAAIPAMREFYRKTGNKIVIYLEKNHPAEYYKGATHPTRHPESNEMVMLNETMIQMMTPLYKAQSFIEDVKVWDGEKVDCDLNAFRRLNVGLPHTSISRWYFYAYPDLTCDLTKPWLDLPDETESTKDFAKGKILINRTERYHCGNHIDYGFLKPYEDECVFIGTMREYNNFTVNFGLNIRKIKVNDFLEYAMAVRQSRFYISNQSQGYQLCQGIFHPSILEVCTSATNVTPIGKDMYDFVTQHGLEYAFHSLNGSIDEYFEEVKSKIASKKEATNALTN